MKKLIYLFAGIGLVSTASYIYNHKEEIKAKAKEFKDKLEAGTDKISEDFVDALPDDFTIETDEPEATIPEELIEEKPKRGRPKKNA